MANKKSSKETKKKNTKKPMPKELAVIKTPVKEEKKQDEITWNSMNKMERVFFVLSILGCLAALVLVALEMTETIEDKSWECLALCITSIFEVFVYSRKSRKYAIFSFVLAFMFAAVFCFFTLGWMR